MNFSVLCFSSSTRKSMKWKHHSKLLPVVNVTLSTFYICFLFLECISFLAVNSHKQAGLKQQRVLFSYILRNLISRIKVGVVPSGECRGESSSHAACRCLLEGLGVSWLVHIIPVVSFTFTLHLPDFYKGTQH